MTDIRHGSSRFYALLTIVIGAMVSNAHTSRAAVAEFAIRPAVSTSSPLNADDSAESNALLQNASIKTFGCPDVEGVMSEVDGLQAEPARLRAHVHFHGA